MTIDGRTLPHGLPIYTFIDHDGVNTHIHAPRLREWCLAEVLLEVFLIPVDQRLIMHFVRDKVFSPRRMMKLTTQQRWEPIIFAKWDRSPNADVLLVDGHHRYARACLSHEGFIRAFVLRPEQWAPFEIVNLPSLTQEELRERPPAARTY